MKLILLVICFIASCSNIFSQIPLDSITYTYFEGSRIQKINLLRSEVINKNNSWNKVKLAQNYSYINREDSAVKYFDMALEEFSLRQDTVAMRAILPELISNINSQNIADFDAEVYVNRLKSLSQNLPKYHRAKVFLKKKQALDSILNNNLSEAVKILWDLKNNFQPTDSISMYSAMLLNIAFCKQRTQQTDSADFYYRKALHFVKKYNDYDNLFHAYLNFGNLKSSNSEFKQALLYLDSAGLHMPHKWKLKSYRILYSNYNEVYKALGNTVKALAYLEAANKITEITNEIEQNRIIAEIETKHQVKQTQAKLNVYEKFIENYRRYKWYYILGLVVTFFLSLYSFVRWKQEDRKRKMVELQKRNIEVEKQKVEVEKQQVEVEKERAQMAHQHAVTEKKRIEAEHIISKEEISTLKKLVEKEHITLKNKSKVHLENLMYIQSDGHYLHLVTSKNKEFIRGKMSEILQELPPNFKQCHRSFIVNKNFIHYYKNHLLFLTDGSEIPVSRKFKPNFE